MKNNTSLSLKTLLILIMASLFPKSIFAQGVDTVYVSSDFTVHMAFPHEVRYVDISGNAPIDAGAIDGYSSILYLKCSEEFSSSCALTVMLSSSEIRTYILCYKKDEITLFVDCRKSPEKETQKDPPTMEGILSMDKMYHHLGQIRGKVMILCDVI